MNANKIVFRSHTADNLMTNDRSGKGMGDTCKKELLKVFMREKYSRFETVESKYLDKGNEREQDALTLLSRVTKTFHKKNSERLTNEYLTGEPDVFIGKDIHNADEIFDTKCSWSLGTFLKADPKEYKWQMTAYMALTGAKRANVAYCLVNGTESAISNEKRILGYQNGMTDAAGNHSPEFIERCKQIEINHIFDLAAFQKEYPWYDFANDVTKWTYDIPMEERLFMISFERDEADIEKLYQRIKDCRLWMNANLYKIPVTKMQAELVV